jgi:hypothetical protein
LTLSLFLCHQANVKHYQCHHDYYLATEGFRYLLQPVEVLEIITLADEEGYFSMLPTFKELDYHHVLRYNIVIIGVI